MSDKDNLQVVVDTATRAAGVHAIDVGASLYGAVVPMGGDLRIVDTEALMDRYADHPRRKTGTVNVTDASSLCRYVGRHVTGETVFYADWRARTIVAVINDHEAEAGWGDHRAVLTLTHTPEWSAWKRRDGVLGNQSDFAEHIEDNAPNIVDPPAADMLELAQTFHATTSVEFKSQTRIQSGQVQLRYEETVSAKAGQAGNLTIPPGFTLNLAVFEGMEPVLIGARLRYRLRDGHLSIGYKLERPEEAIRSAVEAVITAIEQATGLVVLRGTPRQ